MNVGARGRLALVLLLAAVYVLCYAAIKTGLAFAPPLRFAALRALGSALPLLAAGGIATESVLVKRIGLGTYILRFTAWQLLLGGALLLLVSSRTERGAGLAWTPTFVGILTFLALAGTALTTALWYWLVQRDDVGRLSLALFLSPVVGLLLGVVLFREQLRPVELAGVSVTVSAIGIVLLASPGAARGRVHRGGSQQEGRS